MKKKLILALPVLLLALNLPFVRVLSISNRKNFSERIYSLEAAKTGFVISYTHSVNKGRVHDFYRATDSGMLELFMTEFVSYGAGIPEAQETPGSKFSVTDKGYVISDLHRTLPSLLMAVGVVAEHSVSVGKEALDGMSFTESNEFFLKNFFKPQTSLVFEIKRMSVLGLLMTKKI
ncbi:MAG: DUF1850 domain-containing protein [Treponema sp.]|nr:DUF1850 domain-containing protein [Treponema sp.]